MFPTTHTSLIKGQQFELVLPSNPSTGYSWKIQRNGTPLVLVSHHHEQALRGQSVGSPGDERFVFKAEDIGLGELVMAYQRPWALNDAFETRVWFVTVTG